MKTASLETKARPPPRQTLRGTCSPRLGNVRGAHVGTRQQRQSGRRPPLLAYTL